MFLKANLLRTSQYNSLIVSLTFIVKRKQISKAIACGLNIFAAMAEYPFLLRKIWR